MNTELMGFSRANKYDVSIDWHLHRLVGEVETIGGPTA